MKKLLSFLLLFTVCLAAQAQLIKDKEPVDPKYLVGAVPVNANGIVSFEADIDIPATMTEEKAFVEAKHWLGQYFLDHEVNQRKSILNDTVNHVLKVGINEWLVFKSKALVLDRAQMIYVISFEVANGKLHLTMSDIVYFYNEGEKESTRYEAEGFITDDEGLNKRKNGLAWKNGKFRVKTIDAFNFIHTELEKHIKLSSLN